MKTLTVALGKRSYPIFIGANLLEQSELILNNAPTRQFLIVTNDTVAPLYLDQIASSLKSTSSKTVILPDGEQYKTLDTVNLIFDALMQNHFDRRCTLIALGGGVVGDMTGFAAATYQRGVNFIQVPTTLLAQVDSSVGGKTGVNHPLGKNMIGAFYQPLAVIADTNTLNSLEDRELSAGMAEIIKYGLIRDLTFFDWLEANIDKLMKRDPECLTYAIERSCQIKADIVAADELEAGERALLNFGHTFGHAIEAGMGYGKWLHGEAVAAGMVIASQFSQRMGWLDETTVNRITSLITRAKLPVAGPSELNVQQYLDLMSVDKKVKDGKINLVLLEQLGNATVIDDYEPSFLVDTLQQHCS